MRMITNRKKRGRSKKEEKKKKQEDDDYDDDPYADCSRMMMIMIQQKMILMQADIDEDVYASARKLEDREYDEKEAMNEEREEQIEMIQLDYTGSEEIRSPRDKSYWTNPQQQLIGVRSC